MRAFFTGSAVPVLLVAAVAAACAPAAAGPATVRPGAPGEASQAVQGGEPAAPADAAPLDADVRFMQHMIHHHAQALEMAALVPERTERSDVRLLARRIALSQGDEIQLMQRWLADRGEHAPQVAEAAPPRELHGHGHGHGHAHHDHADAEDHGSMPGMLSPEQMEELARASGPVFDRLFLEAMIFHHEGALQMVAELFAAGGASRDGEIFQFAAHVDSDQRIEIGRMRRMLAAGR